MPRRGLALATLSLAWIACGSPASSPDDAGPPRGDDAGLASRRPATRDPLDPSGRAAFCEGSGALYLPGASGESRCADRTTEHAFRFAVCSCSDLSVNAPLTTDGFDSARGPYTEGAPGGSVGVNGDAAANARVAVGGSLWASGDLDSGARVDVAADLHVGGEVRGFNLGVRGGAAVGGNVTVASMTVDGDLTVPESALVQGASARQVRRAPVSVAPPCGCDDPIVTELPAIVARFADDNDNAAIDLDPASLESAGDTELNLPCGMYYLTAVGTTGLTLRVEGRVALFVAGDVTTEALTVELVGEHAEIDLFVVGDVHASSDFALGDPARPSRSRLFVAGESVAIAPESLAVGNVYAPRAGVDLGAGVELFGAVVAGSLSANGPVSVHYDHDVLRAGDDCEEPTGCAACGDCPSDQACVDGTCGACATDADCCAPLVCAGGLCLPVLQ